MELVIDRKVIKLSDRNVVKLYEGSGLLLYFTLLWDIGGSYFTMFDFTNPGFWQINNLSSQVRYILPISL